MDSDFIVGADDDGVILWSSPTPPWSYIVNAEPFELSTLNLNGTNQTIYLWRNDSTSLDYGPIFNVNPTSNTTRVKTPMNPWIYFAWMTIFTLMIVVAIGGNVIVMWIVIAHRRMRTVTNYFLVNLSVADLLMSILNCTFNFIYMINNHWPFGEWYCTANNFMATVTVSASVYTLTAITCDRYIAIVRPLKPRMSKRCALVAIAFVWVISAVIGAPCLMYSATHKYNTTGRLRIVCILIWPDGMSFRSQMDFTYQVALMVLSYFVPIVLMVWCYFGIGRVLWGSRSIGEMSERQADSIRSKRKVVKMFIFVMMVFIICWLPYHGYFVYTHFDGSILYTKWVQHLYLGFYWLAMSNAMVNPLIYYWMNARFRKYFKTAVCGWTSYIVRKSMRCDQAENENDTPVLARNRHSFSRSDENTEPIRQLSRWFSRRSRRRQTTSTVLRESSKYHRASPHELNNRTMMNNVCSNRGVQLNEMSPLNGGDGRVMMNQNGSHHLPRGSSLRLQCVRRKPCFACPGNDDRIETAEV